MEYLQKLLMQAEGGTPAGFLSLVSCSKVDPISILRIYAVACAVADESETLTLDLRSKPFADNVQLSLTAFENAIGMVSLQQRSTPSLRTARLLDAAGRFEQLLNLIASGDNDPTNYTLLPSMWRYDTGLRELFYCYASHAKSTNETKRDVDSLALSEDDLVRLAKATGLSPETVNTSQLRRLFALESSRDGGLLSLAGLHRLLIRCFDNATALEAQLRRMGLQRQDFDVIMRTTGCSVLLDSFTMPNSDAELPNVNRLTNCTDCEQSKIYPQSALERLERGRIVAHLEELGFRTSFTTRHKRNILSSLPNAASAPGLSNGRPYLVRIVAPLPPCPREVQQQIEVAQNFHDGSFFDRAIEAYVEARRQHTELSPKGLPPEAAVFYHLAIGEVHESSEDDDAALSCFVRAKTAASTFFNPNHPAVALAYHRLGCACYHLHYLSIAERCFDFAHAAQSKVLGEDHIDTVATSHNRACCSQLAAEYSEALFGFKRASHIFREKIGLTHPRTLIATRNWTGLTARQATTGRPKSIMLRADKDHFIKNGRGGFRIIGDKTPGGKLRNKKGGGKKKKKGKQKKS